jgi:OmpA-OmpF porin, OOP family
MKKSLFFFALLSVGMATTLAAQTPKDTINLRDKHFVRQAMYEANQEPFAPPRKNNWSLGIQGGTSMISGDIRPLPGWGFGFNVRRAISHSLSLRFQASMGGNRGQNWRANGGFAKNSALNGSIDTAANYTAATYPYLYYNYKMNFQEAGFQGVWNIGNISFHNQAPKVSFYTFFGLGAMLYNTRVNALDANGAAYDYSPINGTQSLSDRKAILERLNTLLDDSYETQAESHSHKSSLGSSTLIPSASLGLGLDFKLSRRVSLALEHRVSWTGDDLLDGHRWEETQTLTANGDYLNYTTLGFNFRIGKGEESYWWQNPLNTIYSDVRDLKRFGKSTEKDSDNDGVVDSRDKEKNTPEGVMVDAQGRAIDSDGDGLQDFRDKEPFSPKGAEVDKASGIAKDTDGDGVIDFFDQEPSTAAGAQADANGKTISVPASTGSAAQLTPFDMVNFDLGSAEVKQEYYPDIYQVAKYLNDHPEKKVVVVGNADVRGKSDKNDNLSKERAENVAKILSGNFGVAKERIQIDYKGDKEQLVKGLPNDHEKVYEALHFLNRRVEFRIID